MSRSAERVAHCHRGRCGRTAWLREPAGCRCDNEPTASPARCNAGPVAPRGQQGQGGFRRAVIVLRSIATGRHSAKVTSRSRPARGENDRGDGACGASCCAAFGETILLSTSSDARWASSLSSGIDPSRVRLIDVRAPRTRRANQASAPRNTAAENSTTDQAPQKIGCGSCDHTADATWPERRLPPQVVKAKVPRPSSGRPKALRRQLADQRQIRDRR